MTHPVTRAQVRAFLAENQRRLAAARNEGERLAVQHDLADEATDLLTYIQARYGDAEVYRFMWLVEQTKREFEHGAVVFTQTGAPRVIVPSQLPAPKRSNGGAVIVLAILFFLGMLAAFR